jgi:hypothetical protein
MDSSLKGALEAFCFREVAEGCQEFLQIVKITDMFVVLCQVVCVVPELKLIHVTVVFRQARGEWDNVA